MRTLQILWVGLVLVNMASHASALTLKETVQHTLETHPEVLAAHHVVQSRGEEVREAKAGYLPTVDLAAGIGRQTVETPSTGDEEVSLTRHEASASVRQMLFDGFATSEEVNRQEARQSSASYKAVEVEENTALRVAEVYLNLLRQNQLLDLARETLQAHQNIHDQMVLRNNSGVGSKADLDQITARLALAQSNMITAQSNLLDAKTNFYRVTSIYPNLDELKMPTVNQVLPSLVQDAEQTAVEQHPTLLSATADVESAEAQYQATESTYWPRLQLEADQRWDEDVDGVEGDNEDTVVALRVTYNLYNGGADKARRKSTAYLLEQARDIRNNTHRQVIESLRLSWTAFQTIKGQMPYLEMHVKAATDTRTAYQKQFNIGKRTLLDLLNTENEVIESKRALINANYDGVFSQYRVLNSMGQLLKDIGGA